MKLVAYLRVSTDRQAEQGLGLEVQEHAIRRWAKTSGHRVVAWARDKGVSGSNGVDTRLGLLDGLEHLKHKAGGLVVYRLDRLARDLILQEQLIADIKRRGAQLFSTSPSETSFLTDDPDDPSRKLIRQVLGAVSEYERAMIALRMRAGRRRKAERGGYAGGAPQFGLRASDGRLLPDLSEQNTLRRARELDATGLPQHRIAAQLNAEGHRTKRGLDWSRVNVGKILRRES